MQVANNDDDILWFYVHSKVDKSQLSLTVTHDIKIESERN